MLASVQLPDGASLERTQKVLDQVSAIAHQTPGVAQVVTIAGISVLDNSATARQCRRRLHHPQALERARQGRGSALAVRRAQSIDRRDRGRAHPGGAAAADPGHRQRRRRHHADRAARFELRSRQAAGERRRRRGQRRRPSRACSGCMSSFRSGVPQYSCRGRPREDARPCTSRSTRCSPRSPAISDRATSISSTSSAASSRSMCRPTAQYRLRPEDIAQSHGAQPGRPHDPARHAGEHHADGRPLA